jgi:peroxiredoxin
MHPDRYADTRGDRSAQRRASAPGPDDVAEVERGSRPTTDSPTWTLGATDVRIHEGLGRALADFRLPASTGQTLSREAFLDKVPVVVAFVPDIDGEGGAKRLKAYNERLKDFGSLPSQVLAVARATASRVRWKADDLGIKFPILADPTGDFAAACDAVEPDRSFRAVTIVTDRRGKIRHRIENAAPVDDAETAYTLVDKLVAT